MRVLSINRSEWHFCFFKKGLNLVSKTQVQKKQIISKIKTYLSPKSNDFEFDLWAKAVAKEMEATLECRIKISSVKTKV